MFRLIKLNFGIFNCLSISGKVYIDIFSKFEVIIMKKRALICYFTVCTFLLIGTSCANTSKRTLDTPYVCGMNETDKQKWIEEKIDYLEEKYQQKIISVEEDDAFITFIFKTDYMTPKLQVEKESYSKECEKRAD